MRQGLIPAAALLALSGLTVPAYAGVTYDTTLGTPPGVYYGNGNSGTNFGWTVDSENGLELGLQGLIRYQGPVTPTGNVYSVGLGDTSQPGKTGSLWGFAFSAYDPSGLGNVRLSISIADYFQDITVAGDPSLIPDNAHSTDNNGIQNAEALSYPQFDPAYYSSIDDTFMITLTAFDSTSGDQIGQVSIQVNAGQGAPLPEPFSLSIMGIGLAGMAAARRRKTSANR